MEKPVAGWENSSLKIDGSYRLNVAGLRELWHARYNIGLLTIVNHRGKTYVFSLPCQRQPPGKVR